MKPRNLISVFQGDFAIEQSKFETGKQFKTLKSQEIQSMQLFYSEMKKQGCDIGHFDGFFVGYTIAQISKEFDMLRFGEDFVLNIELKSELDPKIRVQKISKQMRQNYYYLKFLGKPLRIFTYVEKDGFYKYIFKNDTVKKVPPKVVAKYLINQKVDYSIDPDKKFVPSKYLVSPFNATPAFVLGNYFLTNEQQKIKKEIQNELLNNSFVVFCLSADAGTGKTLLMYDIAKEQMRLGKKIQIIHCGRLNKGHNELKDDYDWNIISIRGISTKAKEVCLNGLDYVFVDEAQRIWGVQLKNLIEEARAKNIPMFFSFDPKQCLKQDEKGDLAKYLQENYPDILTLSKTLSGRIRTNKAMASFIKNLMKINKRSHNLNYDCVTIEYTDKLNDLKAYINFLKTKKWKAITYTKPHYGKDPYVDLADVCISNAHGVIGQEFSKVVVVMDSNFYYDESEELKASGSYYSAIGMLYQIATRAIDELKIIVLNNPTLYVKLLEIKSMAQSTD